MSVEEKTINSSIQYGVHPDLENARALLEDPPWKDNPQKYRKAAEQILRRVFTVDSASEQSKALLAKVLAPCPQ